MKLIVITNDKCSRMNPGTFECIQAFRPSVVTLTEFVKTLSMESKIEVLEKNLPESATDTAFEKFFNESKRDTNLAVESFLAAISGNKTGDLDNEKAAAEAAAAAEATAAASAAATKPETK